MRLEPCFGWKTSSANSLSLPRAPDLHALLRQVLHADPPPPRRDGQRDDHTAAVLLDEADGTGEAVSLLGYSGVSGEAVLSPDGSRLATVAEGVVRLWDTVTGLETLSLRNLVRGVRTVAFSPDGRHLAQGRNDGTVLVWSVGPGDMIP